MLIPVISSAKLVAQNEQNSIFNEMAVDIQKERSCIIDSVCVRNMKARKLLDHNKLVELVTS